MKITDENLQIALIFKNSVSTRHQDESLLPEAVYLHPPPSPSPNLLGFVQMYAQLSTDIWKYQELSVGSRE